MKDLDYYKKKLLWEKQNILKQISNFNERGHEGLMNSIRDSTGELSNYDNHPADGGTDTFDRSKDIGLKDHAKTILVMIEDALEKVESGRYGHCDSCGEEIGGERLEAMPYSTFCFECKSKSESRVGTNAHNSRPIEETVIRDMHKSDYMSTEKDDESLIYDGEDAWQEVARYGTANTPSDIAGATRSENSYIESNEEHGIVGWEDKIIDDIEEGEDDGQIPFHK